MLGIFPAVLILFANIVEKMAVRTLAILVCELKSQVSE